MTAAAAIPQSREAHEKVPVTVVVSRRPKPGCEAQLEEWLHGVIPVASRFPGHLGATVFRPTDAQHPDYVLLFRFDSQENLDNWTRSPERNEWLARVTPLVANPFKPQVLTGLESWFTLPAHADAPVHPPPRYKMALVTWVALYPIINVLTVAIGPYLAPLPQLLRSLVMTAIMIPLMTYVVMPRLTRLFAGWLYPKAGT